MAIQKYQYIIPIGVVILSIVALSFLITYSDFLNGGTTPTAINNPSNTTTNDSGSNNGNSNGNTTQVAAPLNLTGVLFRITDFKMLGTDDQNHTLSEFSGKWLLLDLMATWCGPCKAVYPVFNKLKGDFPDIGMLSVSISPDTDSIAKLKKYQQENNITWTLLRDENETLAEQCSTQYIPHIMIVKVLTSPDKDGQLGYVYYQQYGAPDYPFFKQKIEEIINAYS